MAHDIFLDIKVAGSRSHVLLLLAFFSLFLCEIISSAAEDPICIEQLIAELAHPDPNRRWDAVAALGAGGDRRAVPPLMRALEKDMKERTGIAMAIIPALGQLGDERAVPLLLKALNKLDEDWLGREAAARALGDYRVHPKPCPTLFGRHGGRKRGMLQSRHWRRSGTQGRPMFCCRRSANRKSRKLVKRPLPA